MRVTCWVICCHVAALVLMCAGFESHRVDRRPKERIVVRTMQEVEALIAEATSSTTRVEPPVVERLKSPAIEPSKPVAQKEAPKKKADKPKTKSKKIEPVRLTPEKPAATKETPANKSSEKPAVKKETPTKPAADKQKTLLKKAQESIAKIDRPHANIAHKTATTPRIAPLGDSSLTGDDSDYRDEIADLMKSVLSLPEMGDVELKVTISRLGKVVGVTVVSAKSVRNRAYLEREVPALRFAEFGKRFERLPDYTFSITLTNE